MKRFQGLLLCTDLDGTLLSSDRTISKENLDAIEYFKAEGGAFTFITGRMPYFVTDLVAAVRPNAPVGCINGGGLYDFSTQSYLYTKELPRTSLELVRAVDEAIEGIGIQINTFDRIYFCRENEAMEHFRRATGVSNLQKPYGEVDEPFAKIVFGDTEEEKLLGTLRLLAEHPKADAFRFIRSEKTLCEILPKGISKGSILPRLAASLGTTLSRTVAMGDYNNDIEMLRIAGIGVAVANATPEVKAVADLVTVSNDESALAAVINAIDRGDISFPNEDC